MALSNTATPIYYGRFRDAVLRGEIPICEEIAMEMERTDELIANPNYYYDPQAIEGFIRYCEAEMTLTDGSDLTMMESFKLWAESLLSWFYYQEISVYIPSQDNRGGHHEIKRVKRRLRKKQYLIVARGSAKSMYVTLLHSYFLNCEVETTDQVTVAPTMKQSEEVLAPFQTAIARSKGPLFKFLTEGSLQNTTGNKADRKKLVSTKRGIQNFLTNSLLQVRPMSIDKLQGLRCKYATVDEWLSGDVREDVVGSLEQATSKHPDGIVVAISSEGTVRNAIGDSIKMELNKILREEMYMPHVSIWHYKLDKVEEVGTPEMWPKANPNIGITVSWEAYHLDVERAEKVPSTRNDILAKRFGLPMEGYTYFFTFEETQPHPKRDYWRMSCAVGADLSKGDDFCAFSFVFPLPDGSFGIKNRSYISEYTLMKLQPALREKYEEFMDEGSLFVMNGTTLDMLEVFDNLDNHIQEKEYDVVALGYDPYNAKEFVNKWEQMNGPFGVVKVPQGARTESVPLGELKKFAEKRELKFDESIMSFCMGNAITLEDTNGNRKLLKTRKDEKIDNVASTMNAYIAYKQNQEAF